VYGFYSFVIAALVAPIHGLADLIYQDGSTSVAPWITGTSAVITIVRG
jgi:hypothetical protein